MKVTLIASTKVDVEAMSEWYASEGDSGEDLAVFSGRACYRSFGKPNPKTATNAGYLQHILEVSHLSILEHGSVTFYLEGISRSLTHELVRSRHFSYSQLSQRYVDESDTEFIRPPIITEDPDLVDAFLEYMADARLAYTNFADRIQAKFPHLKRKEVRQAARSVLPNATATSIVVTGNYRAMRHFVNIRATEHADVEIRALAVEMLRHLQKVTPNVFADYEISTLPDGTEVASSPYGGGDD